MKRIAKVYKDLSDAQPTTIFADVSQRVAFEYAFTFKAMEEMAWQVWKTLNKIDQGNPTNFNEDRSRELFNEWLNEEI